MSKEKKFMTCDGNTATSHIAYMFSELAAIYPITPSSTMAEVVDKWAANGRKNLFGDTVRVQEMQSEAGAAGTVHGSLQAGALTTTFTASQGLLLMIPNMYKISGELLPGVFHIAARAIAGHALSIFGDHQDVMACRATGFAMLCSNSVQEAQDMAAVAHLSAIHGRVPFLHFFDGFRTSHEIQKIEEIDMEDLRPLVDLEAIKEFRHRALTPDAPVTRGTAQNGDIYFQEREASNPFYNAVPETVQHYMDELGKITGRHYHLFDYYGAEDAEDIVICMGSACETAEEVIDKLNAEGRKVGMIKVHLFRPFSVEHFLEAMPKTVKHVAVLDRTKEPGSAGEPLYLDVKNALYGMEEHPIVVGGRYGLSSKDVTPEQFAAVFENLRMKMPKDHFTIGIVDDVTFTSLPLTDHFDVATDAFEAKFYGRGSDGTVGANKNSVKIIGENTSKYCQAYFEYDSRKSGGFTCSHLRFGDSPIRSTYYVNHPHFVACHEPAYLHRFNITKGLRKGGSLLLNSIWEPEDLGENLPGRLKRYLAQNGCHLYIINATKIASEIGLGNRTNTILQSAFFKIANVIPYDLAVEQMKKFIVKSYGHKGEKIVNMNYQAVDAGADVIEVPVPAEWADSPDDAEQEYEYDTPFVSAIVKKMHAQEGDDLPVSVFTGLEDGTWQPGTTRVMRPGVAVNVPMWHEENCIQCNQCAYVCPHATIRPFILDEKEMENAPEGYVTKPAIGKEFKGMGFRIQVDVLDCLGCGNCADVCPGKKGEKALTMEPLHTQEEQDPLWLYSAQKVTNKAHLVDVSKSVKNSQFSQPLFEFSGACAGCGETPYVKLISQLYGDRQVVANTTGCSSIYSASAPETPYTTNEKGHGPAWANSLFEDNAEYGYGMYLANKKLRERLLTIAQDVVDGKIEIGQEKTKELLKEWIEKYEDANACRELSDEIRALVENDATEGGRLIDDLRHYITKKSHWIIGGDGWAYDIGYGGLDHVLAQAPDVNVLVIDTEVYSNTGGQSSKSTPRAAVAQFSANGRRFRKKDLGMMAAGYGYVYVAQIAMGANQAQALKAIREAEEFDGPSLIIAYCPCINHGLRSGMGKTQEEEKRAVECGYWQLWRYDPRLEEQGKNPFQFDSKEPQWDLFHDFIMGEVRYRSLEKLFPEDAEALYGAALEDAKYRYTKYQRYLAMDFSRPEEDVAEAPSDVEKKVEEEPGKWM